VSLSDQNTTKRRGYIYGGSTGENVVKFFYFLLFFCCGCADVSEKKKVSFESDASQEFRDMCRRIGNLNMTSVALGSGIGKVSASQMRELIKEFGIKIPDSALDNKDIFAGADTDDQRLNYFIDAIRSDHKIIWAMRGGYGTARLIAALDRLPKPNFSKIFVGFCDVTAMHLFISQKWPNWRAIHATVLTFLTGESFENKFSTLLDILEGKIDSYDMDGVYPLNNKAFAQKSVTGELIGGNMSIIETSLKTCWEIQTDGKILFVEDIYEKPEQIYRAMYHLKEAGKLSNAKALVFGYFHKAGDPKRLELFLKGFAQTLDIPVYITDKFGHGADNVPLIYNAKATIHDNKMTIATKM
jgi:muramoyltetrapeptide carboxypeptidase